MTLPMSHYFMYRRRLRGNKTGIEIEFELEDPLKDPIPASLVKNWAITNDGSLRYCGYELVSKPFARGEWKENTALALKFVRDVGAMESPRTSIHVHENVQHLTPSQVLGIITTYLLVEEHLMAFAGPTRKGNLFCLASEEANGSITDLINNLYEATDDHKFQYLARGRRFHKYAALNLMTIKTFGTLEFRALGGVYDMTAVEPWVSAIHSIVEYGQGKNPNDVLREVEMDRHRFLRDVLGGNILRFIGPEKNYLVDTNYSLACLLADAASFPVEAKDPKPLPNPPIKYNLHYDDLER